MKPILQTRSVLKQYARTIAFKINNADIAKAEMEKGKEYILLVFRADEVTE